MPYKDYELHKRKVRERYWADPAKAAEAGRVYRAKNPDRIKANRERYFAENADAIRERDKTPKRRTQANEAFRKRYPTFSVEKKQRLLLDQIRKRSRDRGLAFDLTWEKIHWPDVCPVFGVKLTYGRDKRDPSSWENTASFDRLNPKRGYTLDNVVIMSWRANRIKCDATLEEIEKIANFLRLMFVNSRGEQ